MSKNLFLQLCEELHIPHTRDYTNQRFDEHPYKYTLFGLHQLLAEYGVESEGVRFADKAEALATMETPFVAQVSNDLAVVTALTDTEVCYTWYDESLRVSHETFMGLWSGVALLIAPSSNAGEPHYAEHRHTERILNLKRWGAVGSMVVILVCLLILQTPHLTLFHALTLLLNAAGLYVSYLLLLRQLKIASTTADRLCTLLKRASCTDVLDSPAAIAAFGISWSEVGAAYFSVNLLTLLLAPSLLPGLYILYIAALGYTIWSLWYQHFRAHSWCALCLLVQLVFVLQAAVSVIGLCTSGLSLPSLLPSSLLLATYLSVLLILHLALPLITSLRQAREWRSSFRSFKLKKEVFDALLEKEKHYDPMATSAILFGNPESPYRLTILTNPYCNPCAAMHARIAGIRQTDCSVVFVFSSFGSKYDRICRLMIAAYQQLGADRAWQLYEEWYAGGKAKQESFFDNLGLDAEAEAVHEEYARHQAWREQTGFSATPTLLVNGHRMPQTYQIEDFTDLMKLEL